MLDVHLWASLRRFTGGAEVVPVEAGTIKQMLDALVATHPGLKPVIEAGVSVAINGEIITGNVHTPIPDGAEIYLMQRLKGG